MVVCLFHKAPKGIFIHPRGLWSFLIEPYPSFLGCAKIDSVAAFGNRRNWQVAKPPAGLGAV